MRINLRILRYLLLAYAAFDFFIGGQCAGIFPLTPVAAAQFTQVSGTVVDPTGVPYALGTISAGLVLPGGASATLNGLAYTPPSQPVGLDKTGSFIMQLADNTVLLPGGSQWTFLVCSAVGTVQPAGGKGPVCFNAGPLTISGSSQSISAQLQAAAISLSNIIGVANITTVGQGFCMLPFCVATVLNQASSTGTLVANTVDAMQVVIPWAITFTKMTINVTVTSNGNHYYVGLYNSTGTTLIRQGTFTLGAGTGVLSVTVPATTLTPGSYFVAWSADNATVTVLLAIGPTATASAIFNANANRYGSSTATTSGGILPANLSIGTLNTAVTPQPPMVLLEP